MAQFIVQAWGPEFGSAYNPSWELEVGRVTLGVRCFPQSFSMLFWGRVSSLTWSCVWGSQASQLALGTPYPCLLHTGIACKHSMPTQIFCVVSGDSDFQTPVSKWVFCLLSHLLSPRIIHFEWNIRTNCSVLISGYGYALLNFSAVKLLKCL